MAIFSTVSVFEEQVGRRIVHKKGNELDTLDCVYIGPAYLAGGILPGDLAQHWEYPGMHCVSWEVIYREASLAEVHVSYTGKINAGGGGSVYYTDPEIGTSWHEGSISWTSYAGTRQIVVVPPSSVITPGVGTGVIRNPGEFTTSYYSISKTCRYTTKGVSFRYLTNARPSPSYTGRHASDALAYLGIQYQQTMTTGLSDSSTKAGLTVTHLEFQNDQTDFQVQDMFNGTWQINETYMTRAYIITDSVFTQ